MTTTKRATVLSKAHAVAARAITLTLDRLPRERRVRYEGLLRGTLHSRKDRSEKRELEKIASSPVKPIFDMDPDVGFTSFTWPAEQEDLVQQAIANTQKVNELDPWVGKSYFRSIKSMKDYALDSPEMQLATSPEMLAAVSKYLGRLPMLLEVQARISLSDPDKPGAKLEGSQLYHRDMDDVSSVKVWILCSEVKKENGPTVLVPSKISHMVAKELGYKQGAKLPNDEPLAPYRDQLFEATGPVGTSFATDTCSTFHYGSRTQESKERLVLYFQYVSSTSVYFRPLGERAGNRNKKYFSIPDPSQLTPSQRIFLRGYL